MPTSYQLALTPEQETELARARDHARQPYLRWRATACPAQNCCWPVHPQRRASLVASNRTTAIRSATGWPATRPKDWPDCWSVRGAGASPPAFPVPAEQARAEVHTNRGKAARSGAACSERAGGSPGVRQCHPLAAGALSGNGLADVAPLEAGLQARATCTSTRQTGSMRPKVQSDRDDHLVQPPSA